jgi:predicted HicB family RNase H-like nuclease
MKDVLTYKDYVATVHYSAEDEAFYGQVEGVNDLVSFEGQSVSELKGAFIEAIEDYLETCRENGKEPEKKYKGSFNIRIDPDLHKRAVQQSLKKNVSLNQFVEEAISEKVSRNITIKE